MPKFNGTLDNLKHALETEQLQGDWSDDGNGKHTFGQPGKRRWRHQLVGVNRHHTNSREG